MRLRQTRMRYAGVYRRKTAASGNCGLRKVSKAAWEMPSRRLLYGACRRP